MVRIISWNVNGLADKTKARQVLRRLHSLKADVIILQEIYKNTSKLTSSQVEQKVEEIANLAQYFWKTDMHFEKSGKLAILSHYHHSLKIIDTFSNGRIMDFEFSHIAKGDRKIKIKYFTMKLRAVYAPAVSGMSKSQFWTKFPPLPPLTWVVGDFNLALNIKDRSARTSSDNPKMVNDILEHHLDTQYLLQNRRPKPTYHHPSTITQKFSRIDYIFAPDSQLRPCARFRLEGPGLLSDHSILILDNLDSKRKTAPTWRMNIKTLDNRKANTDIINLVKNIRDVHEWDDFKNKVKRTCQRLGQLNEKKKKDSITNLTNRLHNLRQRTLTDDIAAKIESTSQKLGKLETDLAERLAIKSGTRWLEEGERSSSYFYQRFSERLQLAKIPDLTVNGATVSDAQGKARACRDHLQQQWDRRQVAPAADFPWHCPKLEPLTANSLIHLITQEEIANAISQSPNGKAPGPDGIPSEFYKKYTDIITLPLMKLFNDIMIFGKCAPVSWAQSKCILIPKKTQGLDNLANWRPITLENCDLKIFSRILSNRTQRVIAKLIGKEQTGFIAGRRIHHSVLSIETAINSGQHGSYLLSLDWSKAYDKVNHQWLSHCLNNFGFPKEFTRTIEDIFYNRNASVSVEEHEEVLQCKQGVPQGDPIAPLLFVLALEPLLAAARVAIQGIDTPKGPLTNTAFADDSTFFIKDDRNVEKLIDLLQLYSDTSGAVVNWGKSALTPLSNATPIQHTPFTIMNIQDPPDALGFSFPLNAHNNNITWERKINGLNQILAEMGSRKSLTYAGRVLVCKTLILSRIWYVATVIAPSPSQIKQLQSMVWKFIFGKSCIHPSRPVALLPKKCGGISAPDVLWEIKTYSAHLYHQAIVQQDTPWGNHLLSRAPNPNNVLPAHAFLQEARRSPGWRGWRANIQDYTLVFALIAWHSIQKSAGGIINEHWTHKQIKYLIQPKTIIPVAPPLLVQMPLLRSHKFKWDHIWSKEFPPKIREILWRMAYNALPSRGRLRHYTELDKDCTLCGEYEDGPHMVRWCPRLLPFFRKVKSLCRNTQEHVANLIYGIAQYAIYLDNVLTRLHGQNRSLRTLDTRFKGLLTFFYHRSNPDIQQGWPSGEDFSRSFRPGNP